MTTIIHLPKIDMPHYKLFHNGRPCTLHLKAVTPRDDGSGEADFEFDFIPRKPTPADIVAFEREMIRMGIRLSEMDIKTKDTLRAVWNARGIVDAEAVAAASGGEGQVDVGDAVDSILRNGRA